MRDDRDSIAAPARELAVCLDDLASVLDDTTDSAYAARPVSGACGSIGAHVRHCLDHVHAVLSGCAADAISYDHRLRDLRLEHNRVAGVDGLRDAALALRAWAAQGLDKPLALEARLDRAGGCVRVESSIARELVFVVQHTIHHQAVIALLLSAGGTEVPRAFGYAPSTPLPIATACAP